MLPLNTTTEVLTVAEARRRLGDGVTELVEKMMQLAHAISAARREIDKRETDPNEDIGSLACDLDMMQKGLRTVVGQLNEKGALVKDAESGLIDFFGWRGDEMVCLCWLHGEKTITHWHGIEEGFMGRKPIDGDNIA